MERGNGKCQDINLRTALMKSNFTSLGSSRILASTTMDEDGRPTLRVGPNSVSTTEGRKYLELPWDVDLLYINNVNSYFMGDY